MSIDPLAASGNLLRQQSTPEQVSAPRVNNITPPPTEKVQAELPTEAASKEDIQQAVEQIQQVTESLTQNLRFSIDEDTGITVIKVTDSQTQEVIRQIPTEEAVSLARTLDKVQGLLFSDKA